MNHRHVYVEITHVNLPGTLLVKPKWLCSSKYQLVTKLLEVHLEWALIDGYLNKLTDPSWPSQPPPFSMPSKLLILHNEPKPHCFTVSCVPESMLNYIFSSFMVISFVSTCSE